MVDIELRETKKFLSDNDHRRIDLMKINIEGGEYELLDHLVEVGLISDIKNIQVQFHHFVPNAEERMKSIHGELERTHMLTYQYKFLWENWKLKND